MTAAELFEKGLVGLLPLLPLTKDGASRQVVDDMVVTLVEAKQTESLMIGYALATKVMTDDLRWLKWRFSMLGDFLRDLPAFQEVLEEGMEKGIEKGREEELQRQLTAQRNALLDITIERFPELTRQAKEVANTIDDAAVLLRLIVKMSIVSSAEEAKKYLLSFAQ